MDQIRRLSQRRTYQLDPDTKAEFFDVATKSGRDYVGVRFEQRLPDGREREFRIDLERLEAIGRRAAEYAESGERAEQFGRIGDTQLRFKWGMEPGRGGEVTVQLLQKARDGSEEWQAFSTRAGTLDAAVRHGHELESDLGYEKRWHVLVNASSLTQDDSGRIHAQAVASYDSDERAREHLGKSTGLALYSEPQRHPFQKGDRVELWADAGLLTKGPEPARTVEQQLAQAEFSRERMSENYVVARWNDAVREPGIGQRVTWEGTAFSYNGNADDFRAGPVGVREPGESDRPLWVLVERDEQGPGRGTVRAFSEDRHEMTNELARREGLEQALGRDWERQSFGMDRSQYTQDYTM